MSGTGEVRDGCGMGRIRKPHAKPGTVAIAGRTGREGGSDAAGMDPAAGRMLPAVRGTTGAVPDPR